jgi:hypothetical protein
VMLLKLFGPDHVYVTVPVVVVFAKRFNVEPLHTALLLVATGVAGGVGSDKVNGPTGAEGQPFRLTTILSYTPAGRFPIVSTPDEFEEAIAVCAAPSFVYVTLYDVLAVNPFRIMVPVADAQVVGLVLLVVVMVGVGFTVTVAVPAVDVHVAVVAVTL